MKNEQVIECLLCKGVAELKYEKYPGYQKPDTYNIYNCHQCNTSFSLPRIEANNIYELIYKHGPKVRWYDIYWINAEIVKKSTNPLKFLTESEASYWAVQESLKTVINKDANSTKILEIGCGLGYLTYSLNKAGYNSIGLDISKEAINKAIENYGDFFICADLHEYSKLHMNEYDVIIFTEVIEHLDNIYSFMSSLVSLLSANGKIILTTPNKSFYPKNVLWATDLPPVHHWWLSEDSIIYIANKFNLAASFVDFTKFYNKNVMGFDVRNIQIPITPPVFEKDGTLLGKSTLIYKPENYPKKYWKRIIIFIYAKLRYYIIRNNSNYIIPGRRGPTICAIIQKQKI